MPAKNIFKFLFHLQTLLLILAFLFLVPALDSLYTQQVSMRSLLAYHGTVLRLDSVVGDKKLNKKHLNVTLTNNPNHSFELIPPINIFTINQRVLSNIHPGDSITIFTIPHLFWQKKSNDIIKLVKGNRTLIDYYELTKEVYYNVFIIDIVLFIIFFLLYFFFARKRYRNLRSSSVF